MTGLDVRTNSSAPAVVDDHFVSVVETYQVMPDGVCRTMYHEVQVYEEVSGDSVLKLRITQAEAFELAEMFLRVGRRMA